MSDTQTSPVTPATPVRKRSSLVLWALMLLLAIAALVAAVMWAGGVDAAEKLLGVSGLSLPGFQMPSVGGGGSKAPVAVAQIPAQSQTSTVTLPPEALSRMYSEQIESHVALEQLVTGKLASFKFGSPMVAEDSATIPITATALGGSAIKATITFAKYQDTWYFVSIMNNHETVDRDASLAAVDQDVAKTITEQQGQKATQEMLSRGLLGGGFTHARVDGVEHGAGTATVDLSLFGGTQPQTTGRIVCVSKVESGTPYWFVVRFEKR